MSLWRVSWVLTWILNSFQRPDNTKSIYSKPPKKSRVTLKNIFLPKIIIFLNGACLDLLFRRLFGIVILALRFRHTDLAIWILAYSHPSFVVEMIRDKNIDIWTFGITSFGIWFTGIYLVGSRTILQAFPLKSVSYASLYSLIRVFNLILTQYRFQPMRNEFFTLREPD